MKVLTPKHEGYFCTFIDGYSTYVAFTGNKPDLSRFRMFGCKAYAHIPDSKRHKLQPKTMECIFLGFAENRRAYRLLQKSTSRIVESRDVTFDGGPGTLPSRTQIDKLEEAETDTGTYQSQLGAIMYAMLGTRPDLAYAVTALSQHTATPGNEHAVALTHVSCYLRKHSDVKLVYTGTTEPFTLTG
jgi:hypothetical protein